MGGVPSLPGLPLPPRAGLLNLCSPRTARGGGVQGKCLRLVLFVHVGGFGVFFWFVLLVLSLQWRVISSEEKRGHTHTLWGLTHVLFGSPTLFLWSHVLTQSYLPKYLPKPLSSKGEQVLLRLLIDPAGAAEVGLDGPFALCEET